eukprot:CAMPEP_0172505126 /NCGR_PEP_ID=MMETSP1066-20121228/183895_1 /TAXON_ID=671091 /ORGANISM="Coscinodiscus wailesii, Strain CCMP2513" /LENGTH=202 /DNA_ID=CAMNT_0013281611 /DNA_START=622 /DNA_END=1230 /DNA_ORIENTATION=-
MFRPGTFRKKALAEGEDEPDFYGMSERDPLPEVDDLVNPSEVVKKALDDQKQQTSVSESLGGGGSGSGRMKDELRSHAATFCDHHREDVSELFKIHRQREYLSLLQAQIALEERLGQGITFQRLLESQSAGNAAIRDEGFQAAKAAPVKDDAAVSRQHIKQAPDRLQELMEISQYFRSRRGEYESVMVDNKLTIQSRHELDK